MSLFDTLNVDESSFSWRDLQDMDVWTNFDPVFGALTIVGTPTYKGRYRMVGRQAFFQVSLLASTSIASVAGTDYLTLPFTIYGLAGAAVMVNDTTNIAVGTCHIDVATSRCYLPTQTASGNTFNLAGWCEI